MFYIFGIIFIVFIVGLIVSKGSIRRIFLAGLRFISIFLIFIASAIWIFSLADSAVNDKREEKLSYDNSAYILSQQKKAEDKMKKSEAEKIRLELLAMIRTRFHDDTCFRAWYEPFNLIEEIYKKYEEDFEWKYITPIELLVLIDNGFAEAGGCEVVIFNREKTNLKKPIIPLKRNDEVRKNKVPLSEYYCGPYSQDKKYEMYGYRITGFLAVVLNKSIQMNQARKLLDYRRKLDDEELKKYNTLYNAYKKYEAEGFYS